MHSPASSRLALATWQTSRSRRPVKPRRFMQRGAAVLAALMLAGAAAAQGSSEDSLLGTLDLKSQLSESNLFAEAPSSSSESSGYENISEVRQNGEGNLAEVRQTGSAYGAFALVAQYGTENTIDVTQCACGNFVDILQDGNSNLSEITQSGHGNVFVHRQFGDALGLSVSQYGGAQISITQTGP